MPTPGGGMTPARGPAILLGGPMPRPPPGTLVGPSKPAPPPCQKAMLHQTRAQNIIVLFDFSNHLVTNRETHIVTPNFITKAACFVEPQGGSIGLYSSKISVMTHVDRIPLLSSISLNIQLIQK